MRTNIKWTIINGLLAFIIIACNIVEVEPKSPTGGGDQTAVNRGSGSMPTDSISLITMLHNNSSKVWSAEEFTIEGLSMFQQCRLDDMIELFSDGTYIYNGGNELCGAEDNKTTKSGTWVVDFQQSKIIFDKDTQIETIGSIITLENNLIVLSGQYVSDLFGTFELVGRYTSN